MPVVFDQPNSNIYNADTIDGGATIAAAGVRLTNTDSGRIYGGVLFTVGGSTLTNLVGGWIGFSSNVITGPLIMGSDGADTVVNGGIIAGATTLGAGDDIFVAQSLATGTIDLGSGDDTLRVEETRATFVEASGGTGTDRLVFNATGNQYWAGQVTGFEQLVFENGGNFDGFSGFQSITVQPMSGNIAFVNLVNCFNPVADVAFNGPWLIINNSTVRSVTGNDDANALELAVGGIVSNGIALGGGDDTLILRSHLEQAAPSLASDASGGAGVDTIMLNWFDVGDRSYDLSRASGFEKLNVNSWYVMDEQSIARVSHASGLTDIDIGQNDFLVLSQSQLADARVGGGQGGGLTLEAGVVIDRYGFDENGLWDSRLDIVQGDPTRSVKITNHGTVENDIRFYIGDDLYDGRDGAVGGTVYGNAGNDRLLGGSGAERFIGGYGADTLQGGGGADILTGGAGYDLFTDSRAGHDGDTITDFTRGDRLVFSDATLGDFTFSVSGNVMTYTGGSLTLQGFQGAGLSASQLAGGGVQITFASPPIVIAATSVTLNDPAVAPKGEAIAAAEWSSAYETSALPGPDVIFGEAGWKFMPSYNLAPDPFAMI